MQVFQVRYIKYGKSKKYLREPTSLGRAVKALSKDGKLQGQKAKRGRKGARCKRRQNVRRHVLKHCSSYCLAKFFSKI